MAEGGLSVTLTDGTTSVEAGPWEESSIGGCTLKASGEEFAHYEASDGKWHITDGKLIGKASLNGSSWPNVILGQAK